MKQHQEGQERRVALIVRPVQKVGEEDRVSKRGDGEELRHALQERHHDRLERTPETSRLAGCVRRWHEAVPNLRQVREAHDRLSGPRSGGGTSHPDPDVPSITEGEATDLAATRRSRSSSPRGRP